MESRLAQLNKSVPRHIRARAAWWVTELHGPDRNAQLEEKVRRWITRDPRHAAAFELATEAWQRSGDLPLQLSSLSRPARLRARRRLPRMAGAAVAALLAAVMAALYVARDGVLSTGPGEQRTLELSDGTQLSLNANSRVRVHYDDQVRNVTLQRGEALFKIRKHQSRPFVVILGDRKVVALGTSFMVRREESGGSLFAITLMEGRVAVEPLSGPNVLPQVDAPDAKLLVPGQRLRFEGSAAAKLDAPSLDKITAWQRGQLIFDDTSLGDAAAEFNRYGLTTIVIDGSNAASIRVGGVFRIGDAASFVQAVARAHRLGVVRQGQRLVLTDALPE